MLTDLYGSSEIIPTHIYDNCGIKTWRIPNEQTIISYVVASRLCWEHNGGSVTNPRNSVSRLLYSLRAYCNEWGSGPHLSHKYYITSRLPYYYLHVIYIRIIIVARARVLLHWHFRKFLSFSVLLIVCLPGVSIAFWDYLIICYM